MKDKDKNLEKNISRLVKQVISLGGNIAGLVPPSVEVRLRNRVLNGV